MKRVLLLLFLLGCGLPLAGFEFGENVKSADGASLRIGGSSAVPMVYDGKWRAHAPDKSAEDGSASLKRLWKPGEGLDFTLSRTLEPLSERELKAVYTLSSDNVASPRLACLNIALPAGMAGKNVTIGTKAVTLPEKPKPGRISQGETDYLCWEEGATRYALTGKLRYELRDTRKDGKGGFYLRLLFAPEGKEFRTATVEFTLSAPALPRRIPNTFPVPQVEKYRDYGATGPFPAAAGSALDLSFLQDAPAGKHGRLVVRNGHFEFEKRPGTPVRLYGANLCFDTLYQSKEAAEKLADSLARVGYNAVRIHHYDGGLTSGSATSAGLNPEKLDQLDYLVSCLRKRGIYFAIDLYCSRNLKPGEIPEHPSLGGRSIKTLSALYDSAMDNWKQFVGNLLNHRNPYTGLTWAEEPSFAICSLLNEDPLFTGWSRTPEIKAAFEKRFAEMEKARGLAPASGEELLHRQAEFLTQLQNDSYDKMRAYLKNDLKCDVLVSGVNYKNAEAQSFIRDRLDYVDNHSYFNHPSFPGKSYSYPVKFQSRSPIALRLPAIRDAAHSRIYGKPFTITETNYVYPNRFRAVGGAILGGFGGYQDYDGIFRFAWSHKAYKLDSPVPISYYDIVQDPINLLSERIGALLFLRREVEPSRKRAVWLYDESAYQAFKDFGREAGRFPGSFNDLALLGQLGSARRDRYPELKDGNTRFFLSKYASPLKGAAAWPDEKARGETFRSSALASDTGQIRLLPKRNFLSIVTPQSEFIALEAGERGEGTVMRVDNKDGFGAFCLTSVDGAKPLPEAERLLLLFLTDVQNSGIAFDDAANTVLRNWGTLPLQLRHGVAELSLRLPGSYRVYALRPDGSRGAELKPERSGRELRLGLDNFRDGGVLAYELVRSR
ncbi:MAG: hypothetical protein HPZ91_14155 [Lentisphaeria bacterium]|nr:hypothetical protein [Lentisphaeria bacterium]